MFPTRNQKFATAKQFQIIREYYETIISPERARTQIRTYEIEGWTEEQAATEIRRLEELKEKGLPLLPENYEKC